MLGTHLLLPFIALVVGAFLGMGLYGKQAFTCGAGIGSGVGCTVLAAI